MILSATDLGWRIKRKLIIKAFPSNTCFCCYWTCSLLDISCGRRAERDELAIEMTTAGMQLSIYLSFFLRGIEGNSCLIKDPSQECWTTKHHPTSQVKLACKWLFACSSPKQKLSDYTVQLGASLLGGSAISQRDASSSTYIRPGALLRWANSFTLGNRKVY